MIRPIMFFRSLIVLFAFLGLQTNSIAGDPVKRIIGAADARFDHQEYDQAVTYYLRAARAGAKNEHVSRRLGECYLKLRQLEQAEVWYAELVKYLGKTEADMLAYAEVLLRNGKYSASEAQMELLASSSSKEHAERYRSIMQQRRTLLADSSSCAVTPSGVNTEFDENAPAWCSKGRLLFSSTRTAVGVALPVLKLDGRNADLFIAERRTDGTVYDARPLTGGVNTIDDENAGSCEKVNVDLVFSRIRRTMQGLMEPRLFTAQHGGNDMWQQTGPLFSDTTFAGFQPAISSNGRTLVFASGISGGIGGSDLYISVKEKGVWSQPVNLGSRINTAGNEVSPYLDDTGLLFFASDGHVGLGGFDIYMASVQENALFGYPVNIGAPINSGSDDTGFILDITGKNGYFASNRPGGAGGEDIYKFRTDGPVGDVAYRCAGRILDEESGSVRMGVLVQAITEDGVEVARAESNAKGEYALSIQQDQHIRLICTMPGYAQLEQMLGPADMMNGRTVVRDLHMLASGRMWLKGVVERSEDGAMAGGVSITLMDLDNFFVQEARTDAAGEFRFSAGRNESYDIRVSKAGYYNTALTLSTGNSIQVVRVNNGVPIILDKIIEDEPVELPHALGPDGPERAYELGRLVDRLVDNPTLRVGIALHAPVTVASLTEQQDPLRKAQVVIDDLVKMGVPKGRLQPMVIETEEKALKVSYIVLGNGRTPQHTIRF